MDTCQVITPCGTFSALWSDDKVERVKYVGSFDGICYFQAYLDAEMVTGDGGARLSFDTLEPGDLRGFCDSESYGIVVEQDASAIDEAD